MLQELRDEIDNIDRHLVELLMRRYKIVDLIFLIKEKEGDDFVDTDREEEVLTHVDQLAQKFNLSRDFVRDIWNEFLLYSTSEDREVRTLEDMLKDIIKSEDLYSNLLDE